MTINELKLAAEARPFKPFTINMSDGRRFHVSHPGAAAMLRGLERTVFVAVPREEAAEIVDLLHVTSLSIGQSRPSNGRKRKAG